VKRLDLLRATTAVIALAALVGGNQRLLSAQEINEKDLPVSLRHGTASPEPPSLGENGTWLGALTRVKCSKISLLPSGVPFSGMNRKLRIETIELHAKRHEPSVWVIATRLQEERALDEGGTASLAGIKPGRYVLVARMSKKKAIGTIDVPKEPANCTDEIPVVEAEGYWAIGGSENKHE